MSKGRVFQNVGIEIYIFAHSVCLLSVGNVLPNVYRRAKGKEAAVFNHKPTKVLQLSTSSLVATRKPAMQSLHRKLSAS